MKTINFLLLLITITFLVSCSDDDALRTSDEIILGEWIGVNVDYSSSIVTEIQGETIIVESTGEGFDIDYRIVFNENPMTIESEGTFGVNLTTTVNEETITEVIENLQLLENGNWSISGNEITIENNGEPTIGRIVLLTDTALIVSVVTETDLSESGISVISTIDSIVTFTR